MNDTESQETRDVCEAEAAARLDWNESGRHQAAGRPLQSGRRSSRRVHLH